MTGVHEQATANNVEAVRLFYIPVNLTIPALTHCSHPSQSLNVG
jgi:hypothetical protein